MLSVVAQDLETALQNAMDMAGMYVGIEAPLVHVDRDFNLQTLDSQQVAQYQALYANGVITHETLLLMLKRGECLPDSDVDAEVEAVEAQKLTMLDINAAGGTLMKRKAIAMAMAMVLVRPVKFARKLRTGFVELCKRTTLKLTDGSFRPRAASAR